MDANTLRKQIRRQRQALTEHQRQALSRTLCRRLVHSGLFRAARQIACYLAVNGEMETAPLIREIWRRKKRCYLPTLNTPYAHSMMFAHYTRHSIMSRNRFNIAEPRQARRHLRKGRQLDLVLLPLVAFDDQGNRLGMGGGFYDRTFAGLMRQRRWRKPKLVGVAYEFQKVTSLDCQPWDVPLDAVATEQKIHYFNHQLRN